MIALRGESDIVSACRQTAGKTGKRRGYRCREATVAVFLVIISRKIAAVALREAGLPAVKIEKRLRLELFWTDFDRI